MSERNEWDRLIGDKLVLLFPTRYNSTEWYFTTLIDLVSDSVCADSTLIAACPAYTVWG